MTSRISKGSITGRKSYSDGGLALSIGTRSTRGIRHAIARRAPDSVKIAGSASPTIYKLLRSKAFGTASPYTGDKTTGIYFTTGGFDYLDQPAISPFAPHKLQVFESIKINVAAGKYAQVTNIDESLIKTTNVPNVYTITIPTISTTAGNWTDVDGAGAGTMWTLTAPPAGFGTVDIDNGTTFAGSSTLITTYLSGKMYTLTMTGTDTFTISGEGVLTTSFTATP